MACSNCFNGCVDIISDQCVRYIGVNVPSLGIQTGDTLSRVEQVLIDFLQKALDATGIYPSVEHIDICPIVRSHLPACEPFSLVDITTALINAACDLQVEIDSITADIASINATLETLNLPYSIPDCLTGTIDANSTHSVLQAVVNNFCALSNSLPYTYVKIDDVYTYISDWFNANQPNSLISNKMVPYAAVPFFDPDISGKFDGTGKGLSGTIWENIYLCNGGNPRVPDLRGVVPVGRTDMGSNGFNPIVNPSTAGNPTYDSFTISGNNNIYLSTDQIPSHTHTATPIVTELPHTHFVFNNDINGSIISTDYAVRSKNTQDNLEYQIEGSTTSPTLGKTSLTSTGLSVSVTNANTGGGQSHSNIQPVIACYYIIYIPA